MPPLDAPALRIAAAVRAALLAQAQAEVPREACGMLVGAGEVATQCWPLPNEAADPHAEFLMSHGLFAASRRLWAEKLRLLAFYHSHPAGPPVPSAADRARNFRPDLPQVIVGHAPEWTVRAWLGARLESEAPIIVLDD